MRRWILPSAVSLAALFSAGPVWAYQVTGTTSQQLPGAQAPTPEQHVPQPPVPAATGAGRTPAAPASAAESSSLPKGATTPTLAAWRGLRVAKIEFQGVTFGPKDPLPAQLPQQEGKPLDPAKVTAGVRRLFATGRYRDIRVDGERAGDGVTLIYAGTARFFVGKVTIDGVKSERLASQLEYATKLNPGAAFADSDVATGEDGVKQALANNGYFAPKVSTKTDVDHTNEQVNVTYTVDPGTQARIGNVTVEGKDPGFDADDFRSEAKLKHGKKVNRDTVSNALSRLRTRYQKRDRLEATASLHQQTYNPQRKEVDYDFTANQGPLVKVTVQGAKLSKSKLKLLVPIYQEGTIDNDLLNEGTFNIQDYLFREGYFDAAVTVQVTGENTPVENVVFSVEKGVKRKVAAVTITGNKYFDEDTLEERMQVRKADLYVRNGRYSPALMKNDEGAILALYRANGFDKASVSTAIKDVDATPSGKKLKVPEIDVQVKINEGAQQKFGTVSLTGVDDSRVKDLQALMNAQSGQPYSLITLSGDRDAILDYYLSHGFSQARIEVKQQQDANDPAKMDVALAVTEGEQAFIDRVLVSGIVHTRSHIVDKEIKVHAGDPLNQSALLDTQRNLYSLALFNEVNTAVQDPDGDDLRKNVLVQLTEARRWDVTYGFGFEAETGRPKQGQINCASAILLQLPCNQPLSQNGTTGVSPRVSLDVSRINLRGTDESLTLHSSYGLLEEVATLTFQNPHFRGRQNLANSISGGYSNVQNISTFQASTLQGDFRLSQKFKKTDTLIYNFVYRRVAVNPATLQVSANLIPQLSQPVRVGGPGITWFHDTRDPGPLDATRGMYTSVQEFFANSRFGSQANFNRVDVTNSSYYSWGKHKYTLARSTRLGFETTFGANPNVGSTSCSNDPQQDLLQTNASCNAVPLPERLYAGGATSHRGFGINDAGPRDLQTGFPVGGNGVFVNSLELRMPPMVLPFVGDNLNFVFFHDMGNAFAHVSDIFPSFLHFHQPNQQTCASVGPTGNPPITSAAPFGICNFNYFSHAVGLGVRYKTPVGPIRLDFSYNLNPPVYPVIYDFNNNPPYEGQAPHFNFFFSIGQAF
ncbi:MAG TPA: POTRA domain-containing protein [Acidobacteriaceae bacterium]|nr:POTRA domain-containing protein [Acidobacteriaceae bacterium]